MNKVAKLRKNEPAWINIFFILFSITFILPLILIISISLSSEADITTLGYRFIPAKIDFVAFKYILKNPTTVANAYKVTAIRSFLGTLIYLLMASMCAYPLSRPDFRYRRTITFYLFFTMLFNGGLVPFYVLMTKYLHLRNTYAALIIPLLGNVWYLFLMRTFFQQIPSALFESAKIDGASDFRIYFSIMLPLSTPVLATVALLQLLAFWNSWFHTLMYISEKDMFTLQYLLQVMMRNIQEILRNMSDNLPVDIDPSNLPKENTRMAMCLLAAGPMMFVFPFFQKYFVKGLTVGSIKG